MSDTSSTPAKDSARRWIGPALLISLVINLFLVGLIGAAMAHRPRLHQGEFGPPQPFFGMMHKGVAGLPPDDRAAVRDMMLHEFPIIRPYFARIDQTRRDLAVTIGTEPFDAAKVAAAFAKVDAAQAEMIQATRAAMIAGFGKMSPEQRGRIAAMMRKQADRRLGNGGQDGPPLPDGNMPPEGDLPPH
ncbi:MAG TPA: periplasmic heavy metal sensor [Parvibaculum sp.]